MTINLSYFFILYSKIIQSLKLLEILTASISLKRFKKSRKFLEILKIRIAFFI